MPFDPHGDFQTPPELAARAVGRLAALAPAPDVVVEPTCGRGAFLAAARERFPEARLVGTERDPEHAAAARSALPGAEISVADAFSVDWAAEAASWTGRVWVVGNPPWVTAAALGRAGATSGPDRANPGMRGIDALTGAANFDLSEWIWLRVLEALAGREAWVGLLCKTQTARRVLGKATPVGLWRIDAGREFGVSVAAGWYVARPGPAGPCPVYPTLEAEAPETEWTWEAGQVVAGAVDVDLLGDNAPPWRSGIKHDCARVLELQWSDHGWINGLGERVDLEPERIAPFAKASDLHRGGGPRRGLVLTQARLGEDTAPLATEAPRTWAYLEAHGEALDGRKSRIWTSAPRFALFGIGPYSFAPWKVAVSSLRSELHFRVIGPRDGRPVLVDDTSYFLPFEDEVSARDAAARLADPRARAFLEARSFPDSKRKITRRALQQLDLSRVRDPSDVHDKR